MGQLPQPERLDTVRVVAGHLVGLVESVEWVGVAREDIIAGLELALRRLKGGPDDPVN